jgi:hypothetical protein
MKKGFLILLCQALVVICYILIFKTLLSFFKVEYNFSFINFQQVYFACIIFRGIEKYLGDKKC